MHAAAAKPALRFLTCGSVDDGKSTLIGRLLYQQDLVPDDQLAAAARASQTHGTTGGDVDVSLLLDGLDAEREQNITIDVAYRYVSTPRRTFIIADAPGHEQYTRNMVTAASNADLAILLVDARKGLLSQTRRHATIAALLGIQHVVLGVNKMDLVCYAEAVFVEIVAAFDAFAASLDFLQVQAIPLSALRGDNISEPSARIAWYAGPPLLAYLEDVDVAAQDVALPVRFPVQWVNRPHADFRGYAGTLASGTIAAGDALVNVASGRESRIARIVTADGDLAVAAAGDAISLVLDDDIDLARGDVLCGLTARPHVTDRFMARLVWMDEHRLQVGCSYLLQLGTTTVTAKIVRVIHRLAVETLTAVGAETLDANDIGLCEVATAVRIAFDRYDDNQTTGGFILIDRMTQATVAAGMIDHAIDRPANVFRHAETVRPHDRASLKGQRPLVVWFTGLSGAGKSTIANLVEARLCAQHVHTMLLDGDNLRHGLCRDLGFTPNARSENIRRVAEVAKLMNESGLVVLCSFISPFHAERQMARDIVGRDHFIEVFVDTPLSVCIARDPKGLYRRALAGEISDFTGIGQDYEKPDAPDLQLGHDHAAAEDDAARVLTLLAPRLRL